MRPFVEPILLANNEPSAEFNAKGDNEPGVITIDYLCIFYVYVLGNKCQIDLPA